MVVKHHGRNPRRTKTCVGFFGFARARVSGQCSAISTMRHQYAVVVHVSQHEQNVFHCNVNCFRYHQCYVTMLVLTICVPSTFISLRIQLEYNFVFVADSTKGPTSDFLLLAIHVEKVPRFQSSVRPASVDRACQEASASLSYLRLHLFLARTHLIFFFFSTTGPTFGAYS